MPELSAIGRPGLRIYEKSMLTREAQGSFRWGPQTCRLLELETQSAQFQAGKSHRYSTQPKTVRSHCDLTMPEARNRASEKPGRTFFVSLTHRQKVGTRGPHVHHKRWIAPAQPSDRRSDGGAAHGRPQ